MGGELAVAAEWREHNLRITSRRLPAPPHNLAEQMTDRSGATAGTVRLLLRAEGLVVLALAITLYAESALSWWWFAGLLLVPDVSMLGYLAGPRVGAVAYNAAHSYIGPIMLALASRGAGEGFAVSLVWAAHCGMDRAAGFGLKYATAFGDTHLGRIGRTSP